MGFRLQPALSCLLGASLALFFLGAHSNRALAAPCTTAGQPPQLNVPPSPWVFGRPITPSLFDGSAYLFGAATFSFEAADPAHPISRPSTFSTSQEPIGNGKYIYGVPLVLHRGDGAARLAATVAEDDYTGPPGQTCDRTNSTVITGTKKGQGPRFKLRSKGNRTIFVDHSCRHENLALVGRVTITVHGDGKTRAAHLNDQCDIYWQPYRADAGHWELRQSGDFLNFIAHHGLSLGDHQFTVTIRFRKHVLAVYGIGVRVALR